jgi:NitT/TauT family transport system substrate-binding protein
MTQPWNPDTRVTRRTLLRGAAGVGLAVAAGPLLPACSQGGDQGERRAAGSNRGDEPPPETTTIRMAKVPPVACIAAQAMAEPFLREEGFTDIQYVPGTTGAFAGSLAAGELDFTMGYAAMMSLRVDAGDPLVMLGGVHVGCWQVLGTGGIRSMSDFKGKTVAVSGATAPDGVFMAMTLQNVGLDLRDDVKLVTFTPPEAARLLSSGEVDGLVAFPPNSQALRAENIGHVVLDSVTDRPWSDYFCCMAVANRPWMEKHPVAAKRALRALLKGADSVAKEPNGAARFLVDGGFTTNFDYACDILKKIPHNVWRQFDPLDSMRFYALRMKEAGLIKSTPEQIIEDGTDFRYLAELQRELKEA